MTIGVNKNLKFLSAFIISLLIAFSYVFFENVLQEKGPQKIEIERFKSDFSNSEENGKELLYKEALSKKEKYIAYSQYKILYPGKFKITFFLESSSENDIECIFEIASSKGKITEVSHKKNISVYPHREVLILNLIKKKEIEPRVRFISGNSKVILKKIRIERIGNIIPWTDMFLRSLYLFPIILFLFLTLFYIFINNDKWKYSISLSLFYTGFFLIIKFAWVSEDAFITMRHIDNFLSGHGPIFNIRQRVEGYTHALWFYIVSLLRAIGLSPKGAMVVPGIIFSGLFLYFLFFRFARDKESGTPSLNLSGAVLIGISCFIDFGTSGLETALSYFLLVIFAIQIKRELYLKKPFFFGLISTLLILNRPDFGIFFIFSILLFIYEIIKKNSDLKNLLKFLSIPLIILSIYEIFRMGYYGAIFPNPFYAKSGSSSYFSQGFKYLADLLKGSAFSLIILFSLFIFFIQKKSDKEKLSWRYTLFIAGILHAFFVIRGGGDFMHGRFLLPTVILLTLSSSGLFDRFLSKGKIRKISALVLIVALFLISRTIIPLQKRGGKGFINGISDERFSFYHGRIIPVKDIFNDEIIFMWKTIGKNYNYLSKRSRSKLTIAYNTVGYIGYYSGQRVTVIDKLGLTDPIIARIKLKKRGRPGHEKSAPFGYLIYRKLTFGETPFPVWNRLAATQYGILWDLSRRSLNKFSFFLEPNFKQRFDNGITEFLTGLNTDQLVDNSDFLFFLKTFWLPYAQKSGKNLFDSIYTKEIEKSSPAYNWINENRQSIEKWERITVGKITFKKFIKNILFAIKNLPG